MQRVRNWLVAETGVLQSGVSHEVSLRFRLDTSQLPKPLSGHRDRQQRLERRDRVGALDLPAGAPGFR